MNRNTQVISPQHTAHLIGELALTAHQVYVLSADDTGNRSDDVEYLTLAAAWAKLAAAWAKEVGDDDSAIMGLVEQGDGVIETLSSLLDEHRPVDPGGAAQGTLLDERTLQVLFDLEDALSVANRGANEYEASVLRVAIADMQHQLHQRLQKHALARQALK